MSKSWRYQEASVRQEESKKRTVVNEISKVQGEVGQHQATERTRTFILRSTTNFALKKPAKENQGSPQRKEDSHEMGLTVAFGVT